MQDKKFLYVRQVFFDNYADFSPTAVKIMLYLLHESILNNDIYHPISVSYSQIGVDCGISKATIWKALHELERRELIVRKDDKIYLHGDGLNFKPPKIEPVQKLNQASLKIKPKNGVLVQKINHSGLKNEPQTLLKDSSEKSLKAPVITNNKYNNNNNKEKNGCLDRIANWTEDQEFLKIRNKSEYKAMPKFEMNPESRKLLEWLAKETEGDTASTRFLEKYQLDLFKYALIIAKSPIAYWIKKMTDFMQNASIVTIPDDYVKASPEELQENWIERQKKTAEITKRNTEKYTKQKEDSDKYYNDMDRAVDDLEKNDPGQFEILREEAFLNTKSKMPYVHEPSTHSMFNRSVRSLIFNQINGVPK